LLALLRHIWGSVRIRTTEYPEQAQTAKANNLPWRSTALLQYKSPILEVAHSIDTLSHYRAYNFAKRLKALKGLTPYQFICAAWQKDPDRFTLDPIHHTLRLNTYFMRLFDSSCCSMALATMALR
jgi:hypothetical protein